MNMIYGKGASGGIAAGILKIIRRERTEVREETYTDVTAETAKLHAALAKAEDELTQLYSEAVEKVGEREAAIFEIHKMMLADEDFVAEAENFIRNGHSSAETAVRRAGTALAEIFSTMEDDYMKARAADILAVADRVADILGGCERSITLTQP